MKYPPIKKICACGCGEAFMSRWRHGDKRYTDYIGYHRNSKHIQTPLSSDTLNLSIPIYAYMFGFFQSDSHFRKQPRNRGVLQIELGIEDLHILELFKKIIPVNSTIIERLRDTNFKESYHSAIWKVHDVRFRNLLVSLGLPYGKKCKNIYVPDFNISKPDYYRGLIDGDGSVGFTKKGRPFISLCTSSDSIADGYLDYIREIIGKTKKCNRNSRDDAYNIMLNVEDAQKMISTLYYKECAALKRKLDISLATLSWIRPQGMRRIPNKKFWDDEQDRFILLHSVEESALKLNRSVSSIKTRLYRLTRTSLTKNLP
jgi:hypothetical protein